MRKRIVFSIIFANFADKLFKIYKMAKKELKKDQNL